jgi:hypothetical protein
MVPGYRFVRLDVRTVRDLIACEIDANCLAEPIGALRAAGRNEHPPARQPLAGVQDQIADGPAFFIEVQILDGSDLSIPGMNGEAVRVIDALQDPRRSCQEYSRSGGAG